MFVLFVKILIKQQKIMKKFTLLVCLLIASQGFSQTVLEDFEGTPTVSVNNVVTHDGQVIDGPSAEVVDDPAGINGKVLKFVTDAAGVPWQETQILLQDTYLDLTPGVADSFTVDVYSTEAFDVLAKVTGGIDSETGLGVADSAADAIHSGSGWETLTFDFVAGEIQDNQAAPSGAYSKVILFNLWDAQDSGTGAGGWTCDPWAGNGCAATTRYFDNITGVASTGGPELGPDSSPTQPTLDAADVISFYGGSDNPYTPIEGVTFDSFGGSTIDGNVTLDDAGVVIKYSGHNYSGIGGSGAGYDVSGMEKLHIDFYTVNDTSFSIKLEDINTGNTQIEVYATAAKDEWVSMDLDLSSFPGADLTTLKWIVPVTTAGTTMWLDNIYFYREALSAEAFETAKFNVFPNPTNNDWNISSNSEISKVALYDVLGKEVISITPNANTVKINSSSLRPGLYFANITGVNGNKTVKLIKE